MLVALICVEQILSNQTLEDQPVTFFNTVVTITLDTAGI